MRFFDATCNTKPSVGSAFMGCGKTRRQRSSLCWGKADACLATADACLAKASRVHVDHWAATAKAAEGGERESARAREREREGEREREREREGGREGGRGRAEGTTKWGRATR